MISPRSASSRAFRAEFADNGVYTFGRFLSIHPSRDSQAFTTLASVENVATHQSAKIKDLIPRNQERRSTSQEFHSFRHRSEDLGVLRPPGPSRRPVTITPRVAAIESGIPDAPVTPALTSQDVRTYGCRSGRTPPVIPAFAHLLHPRQTSLCAVSRHDPLTLSDIGQPAVRRSRPAVDDQLG